MSILLTSERCFSRHNLELTILIIHPSLNFAKISLFPPDDSITSVEQIIDRIIVDYYLSSIYNL